MGEAQLKMGKVQDNISSFLLYQIQMSYIYVQGVPKKMSFSGFLALFSPHRPFLLVLNRDFLTFNFIGGHRTYILL